MINSREKFEKSWDAIHRVHEKQSLFVVNLSDTGNYEGWITQQAWELWQAATEQGQKEIAELQAREKELVEALRYVNKELIMYGYQYESKDSINVVLSEALANVRGE